jgi:hypothetical protein
MGGKTVGRRSLAVLVDAPTVSWSGELAPSAPDLEELLAYYLQLLK